MNKDVSTNTAMYDDDSRRESTVAALTSALMPITLPPSLKPQHTAYIGQMTPSNTEAYR